MSEEELLLLELDEEGDLLCGVAFFPSLLSGLSLATPDACVSSCGVGSTMASSSPSLSFGLNPGAATTESHSTKRSLLSRLTEMNAIVIHVYTVVIC